MTVASVIQDQILIDDVWTPSEMKQIGAWRDANTRTYRMAATRMNAIMLREALPDEVPDLSGALTPPESAAGPSWLFPYQQVAVARLLSARHGQLLALSPGLGKTAVAIAAADIAVPDDKIVVVAPASLLGTWQREIERWAAVPGEVYVMRGRPDYELAAAARWIVVSWDKAAIDADLWGRGWPLWILDESVLVKSRGSKRFKAMAKIRKNVNRVWLLSGSPTTRYADDLWAQLHLIWPKAFGSFWRFAERYCILEDNVWSGGKSVVGTRVARNAAEDNSDLMHVVNQKDVLDLPELLFDPPIEVLLGGAQAKAYKDMAKDFIAQLGSGAEVVAANEVARLMKLQQIASYWDGGSAKHDALLDRIESYEPPYLVWTHWKEGARALAPRLEALGLQGYQVDGDTPHPARDAQIEMYKAGHADFLVLSLGVGKFGHTLVNTNTVFFLDKSWNADDYFQALHRVQRIGLDHSPVVVPIRATGTVDELVDDNVAGKLKSMSKMTRSDLATLLKGLGR